ncbi:Transposase and inactivated derivatives [Segatella buccae]|uniref:Mutator family transposase n=1 Tax=Segatella buccae TaxID=28126 RepID=A0AAQ1UI47_9BACT|nr:Transposase and inactivated derivatives [Segatella buccae]
MDNKEIDYKRAAEQLRNGDPLFGKGGALIPMLERILNAALEGKMDAHLAVEERSKGNRRNGKMPKQVQTRYGEGTVETPRDRDGSFEPQTVKKHETILAEGMADQIINMYAFGTSTRDMIKCFEREFDTSLSAEPQSVFPDTSVQLCIVHQIRNSLKYVGSKHQKEFLRDLKTVYGAVSKETAETKLDTLDG